MKIPKRGKIYAINEGYAQYWDESVTEYVHQCKFPKDSTPPMAARYVGSMVADLHRTLKYGGIFMYPATSKAPKGKVCVLSRTIPVQLYMYKSYGLDWSHCWTFCMYTSY